MLGALLTIDLIWSIFRSKKENTMKYSENIKPISFLKSHASEIIRNLNKSKKTIIITQNGEAKAVVQDIKLYEQNLESFSDLDSRIKENLSK
jgi:prevent-host-death family protein